MRDKQKETLQDIAHQAAEINRMVILMAANNRVGHEWLLHMKHAHERLDLLIGRINS